MFKQGKVITFCWIPSHVGIPGNEAADRAAKEALDLPLPNQFRVPYTDKLPLVKQYVNSCWQEHWNTKSRQKLFEIMPNIGEFNVKMLTRKEQVLVHRIRIGHTRLTQSYHMEGLNPPQCEYCKEPLTVKHFMLFCRRFTIIRNRYFSVQDMHSLFNSVSLRKIIAFIKEIGLYNQI